MSKIKERTRGFMKVESSHNKNKQTFTDEKGRGHNFDIEPQLPTRADSGSAGYDFYVSKEITLLPGRSEVIWTDVKAYMQEDEVLEVYIRSSLAIEHGLVLTNGTGIIDSSYFSNKANDGNIGISIKNTSGRSYTIKENERIAQGIFKKYLITDEDNASGEREGGMGSSGK